MKTTICAALLLLFLNCTTVSEDRIKECAEFCTKQGFGYEFYFSAKDREGDKSDIKFSKCMCLREKRCNERI